MLIRAVILICSMIMFVGSSRPPERIPWSAERSLKWEDFKGTPNAPEGWGATTSSGITQSYALDENGVLYKETAQVTAHFYPDYSWVRSREKTKYLLGHEQTHFDITEIHARKLQARIQAFEFTVNSKEEVRALYDEVEAERIAMQQQFDKETEHSINHPKEIEWELKVERMLNQ